MTCNGCQALRGPLVKLTSNTPITVGGFSVQELLRVTVPPMDDPVKLRAICRLASSATATVAAGTAALVPVGGNLLNALDQFGWTQFPFTDVMGAGYYISLTAWVDNPGDYLLGVNESSGALQAIATSIAPISLWWER